MWVGLATLPCVGGTSNTSMWMGLAILPCVDVIIVSMLSINQRLQTVYSMLTLCPASLQIAHRALCARNILVGTGMDIRIYNVGAFDMTFENRDALMKWMSPETLFDATATTYSDV